MRAQIPPPLLCERNMKDCLQRIFNMITYLGYKLISRQFSWILGSHETTSQGVFQQDDTSDLTYGKLVVENEQNVKNDVCKFVVSLNAIFKKTEMQICCLLMINRHLNIGKPSQLHPLCWFCKETLLLYC